MTDTYSKNEYTEFLKTKQFNIKPCGFEPVNINENAFSWQKKIIEWHCRKGKSAVFQANTWTIIALSQDQSIQSK